MDVFFYGSLSEEFGSLSEVGPLDNKFLFCGCCSYCRYCCYCCVCFVFYFCCPF